MTNVILQDSMHALPSTVGPRFRPFACSNHQVTKGRYITSNDPRGYIPVYEYPLNGQWIMMDIDDGYILWTGIWKALGNSKADIVKMIDSQPDLATLIRRVRGGYLKIQGTWMPYEVALRLSRRVAWSIREDLIPLFGPTFPSTCLSPDQPGYGQVVANGSTRRRARRNNTSATATTGPPKATTQANWTVVTPDSSMNSRTTAPATSRTLPELGRLTLPTAGLLTASSASHNHSPHPNAHNYGHPSELASGYTNLSASLPTGSRLTNMSPLMTSRSSASESHSGRERSSSVYSSTRYTPYPSTSLSNPHSSLQRRTSMSGLVTPSTQAQRRSTTSGTLDGLSLRSHTDGGSIILPPIHPPANSRRSSNGTIPSQLHSHYALPPISALEDLRGVNCRDSEAVLRRLREDDDESAQSPSGSYPRLVVSGQSQGSGRDLSGVGGTRKRSMSALVYTKTNRTPAHELGVGMAFGLLPPLSRSVDGRPSTRRTPCWHSQHSESDRLYTEDASPFINVRPPRAAPSRSSDGADDDVGSGDDDHPVPMTPDTDSVAVSSSPSPSPGGLLVHVAAGRGRYQPTVGGRKSVMGYESGHGAPLTVLPESGERVMTSSQNGRVSACRHSCGEESEDEGRQHRPLRPW